MTFNDLMNCDFQADDYLKWIHFDLVADIIYLMDTIYFRPRLMYLDAHGIYEKRRKETLRHFVKSGTFRKDALSLLPLDWIYILTFGPQFKGMFYFIYTHI